MFHCHAREDEHVGELASFRKEAALGAHLTEPITYHHTRIPSSQNSDSLREGPAQHLLPTISVLWGLVVEGAQTIFTIHFPLFRKSIVEQVPDLVGSKDDDFRKHAFRTPLLLG